MMSLEGAPRGKQMTQQCADTPAAPSSKGFLSPGLETLHLNEPLEWVQKQ